MYAHEQTGERRAEGRGPVSLRAFGLALALHLAVFALFWVIAKLAIRPPDVVIPMDLTIVPPWAEQTDDPDPDPNPPPPEAKAEPKPPQPEPEPPKIEETKPVEAVEKVVEKPKPKKKEKPKPLDLRKKAKLVKAAPAPVADLREKARKIEPPPNVRTYGKGTAADKPLSPEEFRRLMNQGYRVGARNQIANDEATRCVSLIAQAIRREWDKESFNWNPGLRAIRVELQFGSGGVIRGFRVLQGSGDGEVDRTARNALTRLRSVPGLSATFLEVASTFFVSMEPVSR